MTLNPNDYQKLAMRTKAPVELIRERWLNATDEAIQVETAFRGLSDECGEIASNLKSHIEYGKEFDRSNMKEEVGDCLWRLAQICDACGFSIEQAMVANIKKLEVRYPDKYCDFRASEENRDRIAEAEVMMNNSDIKPNLDYLSSDEEVEIEDEEMTFASEFDHYVECLRSLLNCDLARTHSEQLAAAFDLRRLATEFSKKELTSNG